MDANSLMFLLIGIAISAAVFALLVFLFPQVAERKSSAAPAEKTMEQVLAPIVFYGIAGAYRTTERAIGDGYPLLSGIDKKRIADAVYQVLPAQIDGLAANGIKSQVSGERFAELVQTTFDQFDQFFDDHQAHFDQQYETWKQEHAKG